MLQGALTRKTEEPKRRAWIADVQDLVLANRARLQAASAWIKRGDLRSGRDRR
jgi:hypothetical protein